MRVSVLRALLIAHAEMTWNRTRKGLGRRGFLGLIAVLLFLFLGAVPLFGAFGVLGYTFGRGLEQPLVPPLMGGILTLSAVGFGVIGGLLGGARQLTWEAYRSFPVPFRTLFFAETAACLSDLVVLGFMGVMTCTAVAFLWAAPAMAPLMVLLTAQLVLWMIFLQQLVGALAVTSVRRLRRAMVVVVVAAWSGVSVVAGALRELKDGVGTERVSHVQDLWHRVSPIVNVLPPVYAVRSMVLMKEARFSHGLLFELPMLATTFVLAALSYGVLRREVTSTPVREAGADVEKPVRTRKGPMKPRAPFRVVASLHLAHIAGSLQGRFGLIIPLITVVLVKGPLGAVGIGTDMTIPGSVIYIAMAATQLHFNQFGFDGQGVKTLLLLPIQMRDILLGKALALVAYCTAQNAFLLVLLVYVLRPSASDTLAAALLGGCLTVAHALEGHWISAIYPRPLAMHRMNPSGLSGANLLPLGVGMVNAAAFSGIYALTTRWIPGARWPVMLGLLVAITLSYWRLLPRAAAFVIRQRETLVEVLG